MENLFILSDNSENRKMIGNVIKKKTANRLIKRLIGENVLNMRGLV